MTTSIPLHILPLCEQAADGSEPNRTNTAFAAPRNTARLLYHFFSTNASVFFHAKCFLQAHCFACAEAVSDFHLLKVVAEGLTTNRLPKAPGGSQRHIRPSHFCADNERT